MKECTGLFGRLFGHNYEAVIVEQKIPMGYSIDKLRLSSRFETDNLCRIVEVNTKYTREYHGHVCSRCGDVVNR
jgi:hypothetical protein